MLEEQFFGSLLFAVLLPVKIPLKRLFDYCCNECKEEIMKEKKTKKKKILTFPSALSFPGKDMS